jgi:hypothetical protein
MSVQATNGDSGSPSICPKGIHVSHGDSGSPLNPSCKRGRFAPPPTPDGWIPFECRNLQFPDPCPNGICASGGVSGVLPRMEFIQVWGDIHGTPIYLNGVQNSGLAGPHPKETRAWAIRGQMVKRVMVVEVKWSRLGFTSDGQGQGPCQPIKVKVRFEAMVGSLDVDSHG